MKRTWISSLHIAGFGHFAGFELSDFGPGLTVIYGSNEAGKSTLLAYIRATLFGLKTERYKDAYLPLNGGGHGGHIVLSDEAGVTYDIQRTKGTNGGKVTVDVSDGRYLEEGKALLGELLGHTSPALFDSVFAFGLTELEELKRLDDGEVSARIYGAGMGAKELPGLLASIDKAAAALFKKRAQQPVITLTLADLRTAQLQLAEGETQAKEYAGLRARQDALRHELDGLADRLREARDQRLSGERLLRGLGYSTRLRAVEAELAETPRFDQFPIDAVSVLRALNQAIDRAEDDARAAAQSATAVQARAERTIPDEGLPAERDFIALLARDRGDYDKSLADLPKRLSEAERAAADIEQALRPLGPAWDSRRVAGFALTTAMSDEIRTFQERMATAGEDAKIARQEAANATRAVEEARIELERFDAALAAFTPTIETAELQTREQRLAAAQRALREHEAAIRTTAMLREELDAAETAVPPAVSQRSLIWIPFGAAALVLAGGAAFVGGDALPVGIVAGIASAGTAIYFATRRTTPDDGGTSVWIAQLERRLDDAETEVERTALTLIETCTIFGEPSDLVPNEDVLLEIELMLRRERDESATRTRANEDREHATARLQRAMARSSDANAVLERSERLQAGTAQEWRQWLVGHDFDEQFSPSTIATMFTSISAAQSAIAVHQALEHRIARIQEDLAAFDGRVAELCARWELPKPANAQSTATVADDFIRRLEAATVAVARRESERQRLEDEQAKTVAANNRVAGLVAQRKALFDSAGAQDEDAFLIRTRVHQHRLELEEELRVIRAALGQLTSAEETIDDFLARLRAADPEDARASIELSDTAIAELEHERESLQRELGANDSRLRLLVSDDMASETRAEVSVLQERLNQQAHQWAVLTLARTMLTAARTKYEEERQPGVIRDAQQFFAQMTGGRYTNIVVPIGSTSPAVVAADGTRKTPDQLSRGTREQLYLALRLGLIRQFAAQERALPLIVDEVLVNFDPDRARQAAGAFAEMARDHQVLVFTCQPAVVEMFTAAAPDAKVIDLNRVRRSGAAV